MPRSVSRTFEQPASSSFLTGLGVVFGAHGQTPYYVVAVLMKLFAGRAGGRMAARMAEASQSPEA